MLERFGSISPYETGAGLALGFIHLLPATEARHAIDARERALHGLIAGADKERVRTRPENASVWTMADAMLDRQTSLAQAELMWIKGFRASLGRLRR
jgi:hypothetical protein